MQQSEKVDLHGSIQISVKKTMRKNMPWADHIPLVVNGERKLMVAIAIKDARTLHQTCRVQLVVGRQRTKSNGEELADPPNNPRGDDDDDDERRDVMLLRRRAFRYAG